MKTESICSVHRTAAKIGAYIDAGRMIHPACRRRGEEILKLLQDIAWGRAGEMHLPAVETLCDEIRRECLEGCGGAVDIVQAALSAHREEFASHIETHNCIKGECVRLAPAPCQMTCPAGIDVPTYVSLIGAGRDAEAIEVIRKDCPFPWVCGTVCTRPCEFMCVRGRIDTPISIKGLKAFAAERAMSERRYRNPEKQPDKGKKVCVVGAGPSGLSAAYYLALKGYGVRVLEEKPYAGGMLLLGIPRYRLPREIIDREVEMLRELGVEFRFNIRFGRDAASEDLRKEGFEAFFIAIGAQKSYNLVIPGESDFPQVCQAVEFLERVALEDRTPPGKNVIVIGGGNVAIDAARTALRLGSGQVTMAYRRTRAEMPADSEEVDQAEEEGILLSFLTIPIEVLGHDGRVTGLRCLRARMVETEKGNRMVPVPIEGSDFIIEADAVISAIGQQVDSSCLEDIPGLQWTRRRTVETNMASMETSVPGVFAGGDAVLGPATVIEAIGGGKKAADAIERYLSGLPQPKMPPVPFRRGRVPFAEVSAAEKTTRRRPEMPLLNIDRRRTTFQQVELGLPEEKVREEARRCLRCDVCLRCGKCVEICRDRMGIDALPLGYLDFDHPVATDFRKTGELCIACGACAVNCPTGAMRMEDREGERILSLCGTVLNRQKLLSCAGCGASVGPARYIDYIRKRTGGLVSVTDDRVLCEVCSRKGKAKSLGDDLPPDAPRSGF
jgi:NADPH-dependent glutamate synthase beta subunit-like oxidoreductase